MKAGIPQGSVLGPVVYLIYTSNIPELMCDTIHTLATFAGNSVILAVGKNHEEATRKL